MSAQTKEKAAQNPANLNGDVLPALDRLFAETVALFQRLRAVAPLMHAHHEIERDQCTVLQGLDRDGPRTVTEIGNDCGISRSGAQKLVKALQKRDLVEMIDNPENKRSKLASLTSAGQEVVRELDHREVELLTSLPVEVDAQTLQDAAGALGDVRRALNDEQWRALLED